MGKYLPIPARSVNEPTSASRCPHCTAAADRQGFMGAHSPTTGRWLCLDCNLVWTGQYSKGAR